MISSKWQEEVTEVKRVSERIMLVRIRVDRRILCLFWVYAPQAGRAMVDKEKFYEALGEVLKGVKEGVVHLWGFQWSCWRGCGRIRRGSWLSWVLKKKLGG